MKILLHSEENEKGTAETDVHVIRLLYYLIHESQLVNSIQTIILSLSMLLKVRMLIKY